MVVVFPTFPFSVVEEKGKATSGAYGVWTSGTLSAGVLQINRAYSCQDTPLDLLGDGAQGTGQALER